MKDLVSVIMPVHNDENFLYDSIQSVLSQRYENWELLIIDDCSTDNSPDIIKNFSNRDERIKTFRTKTPSGSPTLPRNIGTFQARGRYISFLDSDDKWNCTKLLNQIACQNSSDAVIVYSNYRKMDENGKLHNDVIVAPPRVGYKELLCGNVIGCLTALYDTMRIGKQYFPKCGHEDYVLWLSLLRNGGFAVNTNSEEAIYRVRKSSVSSDKMRAMRWQWNIYMKEEQLGLFKSAYYFINYAVKAVNKQMK